MPGSRTIAARALARLRKYATSRMSGSADFSGETFHRNLEVVDRLKKVAEEKGATLPELAVAWTLAHPAVHVAIVGPGAPHSLRGRRRRSTWISPARTLRRSTRSWPRPFR